MRAQKMPYAYCRLTGQNLALRLDRERLWFEFLRAGFTLADLIQVARLRARGWPRPDPAAALLLNGVWSLMPEKQEEILGWSANHHVLVTDEFNETPARRQKVLRQLKMPVRFLEVTETGQQGIHLDFHALSAAE